MNESIKNITHAQVLTLREEVTSQPGQIVSKTLAQNAAVSITLFAFWQGEEIGTHASDGDAFVTCLEGGGGSPLTGRRSSSGRGSPSSCPPATPTASMPRRGSRCCW